MCGLRSVPQCRPQVPRRTPHMTVTDSRARTPAARPARKPRGEGQWALGHREPLNPNERTKKDDGGLNVRQRVETIYAHGGVAAIDPAHPRGRLRRGGLYPPRKPGIRGGRTAPPPPPQPHAQNIILR